GNDLPARFRANRMRVISTTADLLLTLSVSSECEERSDAMVMGLTRAFRLFESLFELIDFIAVAGGVLVTLRLNGGVEIGLKFVELFLETLALQRLLRHLARVSRALV